MNITLSQLLLSILILFVLWRTYSAYKKRNLSETFIFIWGIFWLGVLVLVFQQGLVSKVANALGISRGVDLVIYISLIVIFFMLYKILVLIDDLNSKITQLVRKNAIEHSKSRKR